MKPYHALPIAGTSLWLLADKAAYWPDGKALLIADAHFGKAATFRALGQPVPQGTTTSTLQRLDRLLQSYPVERLFFLGDFFHAPQALAHPTLTALNAWRKQHASLKCLLIRGNHDLRAGDPPPELEFEVVFEPYRLGPFALRHTPKLEPNDEHVIAGHVHPAFRLAGKGRQQLRLPCFAHTPGLTLLPAFGDFTGGFDISPAPETQIFLADESGVWAI